MISYQLLRRRHIWPTRKLAKAADCSSSSLTCAQRRENSTSDDDTCVFFSSPPSSTTLAPKTFGGYERRKVILDRQWVRFRSADNSMDHARFNPESTSLFSLLSPVLKGFTGMSTSTEDAANSETIPIKQKNRGKRVQQPDSSVLP